MTTPQTLPEPPSPTKSYTTLKHSVAVKSNPHPYAIKTTSTGILSRSNSSSQNHAASRHHYVPPSPSAHGVGTPLRGHRRASKSLSSVVEFSHKSPRPLPVPPEFSSNTAYSHQNGYTSDSNETPRRMPRAGNQPSYPVPLFPALTGGSEDLPSNPKLWTPSQLASYLTTALRVTAVSDIEALPLAVVHDIAAFVKEARITGRIFLRLIEEDLESRGVNQKWRRVLIAASHNLRQNVIKGRIWGPDAESSASDVDAAPLSPRSISSASCHSSSSSVDLNSEPDQLPSRRRHGRVRGMVASFERSGSFSSDSGLGLDHTSDQVVYGYGTQRDTSPVAMHDVFSSSPVAESPLPVVSPVPVRAATQDEPTMEVLLAATESSDVVKPHRQSWGARAWEELDAAPAVTVKRIEDSMGGAVTGEVGYQAITRTVVGPSSGPAGKERSTRRVVTAIFAQPPLADATPEDATEGSVQEDVIAPEKAIIPARGQPGAHNQQGRVIIEESWSERELALAAELVETRAMAVALQKRVEECERKQAELEELAAERGKDKRNLQSNLRPSFSAEVQTQVVIDCPTKSQSVEAVETTGTLSLFSQASSLLPSILPQTAASSSHLSLTSSSSACDNQLAEKEPEDSGEEEDPNSLSELPQYVLLVGVGVCAVVLRVMLKRFGRGWRL